MLGQQQQLRVDGRALTIDNVLASVDQEELMSRFFGEEISLNKTYTNPFRKDNTPSCRFKWINDKLIFSDYASPFWGDAVAICSYRLGTDTYRALEFINKEYNLGLGYGENGTDILVIPNRMVYNNIPKTYGKIVYQSYKDFSEDDYFYEYFITKPTLNYFQVYPCKTVWVSGKRVEVFRDSPGQPIYIYDFDDDQLKMYRPLSRSETKWRGNTACLQGDKQIKNPNDLVIRTSSLKDAMVLYECGYQADAPQSETQIAKTRDNMILLYDNDEAGTYYANEHKKIYKCPSIVLPKVNHNGKNLKDPSDFAKAFGLDYLKEFLWEWTR